MSSLIQQSGDGFLALVLLEELMHQCAYRSFLGMRDEFSFNPLISKRRLPAKGLAQLRAYGNRGGNAGGDFLALPLGHCRDHGVEEAAGG